MINTELEITFEPAKQGDTKGLLTVRHNKKILHCDRLDISKAKDRTAFANKLNKIYPAVLPDDIREHLILRVETILEEKSRDDEAKASKQNPEPKEIPKEAKESALVVLKDSDLFMQISADISSIGVAGESELCLTIYIIMTSRLLEKPLSAIVQGASSSGKSYVIETIAKLMPKDAVVQAHDFTEQSFYYMEEGSLQHKVIVAGERRHDNNGKDGHAEDNSKAFREMVASGVLRKAVTVKGSDGRPITVMIEQPGPIAYVESSTATVINDEDSTRLLPLVTDESADQTEVVVNALKDEAKGNRIDKSKHDQIIQRNHVMQRLLKPLAVRIPYIDSITLPTTNIATRRTFGHVTSMIKSIAILRQYQKEVHRDSDGGEYIIADENDYAIAYQLMGKILARTYSPLNQKSRDLLDILMDKTKPADESAADAYRFFTNQECQHWAGLSEATVRRRLGSLVWIGIVTVDKGSKPYKYRIEKPELIESVNVGLPEPEDIAERIAIMES